MLDNYILEDFKYIEKNVTTLYKYLDFEGAKAMLTNSTLMFRNPYIFNFNDPYDCYQGLVSFDKVPKNYREFLLSRFGNKLQSQTKLVMRILNSITDDQLSELFKNHILKQEFLYTGISCFSEKFDNLLMWSHYSKSHSGICIGLNLTNLYANLLENHITPGLLKVNYTDKLEKLEYFIDAENSLINCFRIKSLLWAYEEEIRIVLFKLTFDQNNNFFTIFRNDIITDIFLGSMIKSEKANNIISICTKVYPDSKIYQMKLDESSFKLVPKLIN
jgi:hypothetical protein